MFISFLGGFLLIKLKKVENNSTYEFWFLGTQLSF